MRRIDTLKVSVSGVRGVVGDSLTPSLAASFSACFGEYVGRGRVVVGRDTRASGPMLERAVVAGLLAVGCQPVLLGVASTPTIQIIVTATNANGGVAITASHNPAEWNALKFIGKSGIFLNNAEAAELLDIYNQPEREYVAEEDYRFVRITENAFETHKKKIFDHINVEAIRRRRFKVAIDCCNGTGAFHSRPFLEELGCEVVSIFDSPDCVFQRKPEPTAENIGALCEAVMAGGCDVGFAQDPDADRLAIVDSRGRPIGEQNSVVLAVEHILSKTPGTVVVNAQTTKAVDDIAARHGCEVRHSKVGEINVTSMMLAVGAVVGGEGGSGGVIWPAVHPCRDSFSAMAITLELMAERGARVEAILDTLPRYQSAVAKVPCSSAMALEVVRSLVRKHADANPETIDGLRLNFPDSWVLIRSSNTEPALRIFAEAATKQAAEELVARFSKLDSCV